MLSTALAAATVAASLVVAVPAATAATPPVPLDLETATVAQLDGLLAAGQTTSLAITQGYLDRIAALSIGGPALNAVQTLNPDALKDAAAADARRKAGATGPLLGIPVLLKDNIDVKGLPTTAGSVALAGNVAPADAPQVTQLRAAGAIILGKTKLTEFANFLTNGMPGGYSSLGGQVLNAYDLTQTPSGSSAGSGVAASVGLAPLTIGSETSGSILSPANANSDVGIKPSVGLIPRTGVIPISATQDTTGPLTKTVADAAVLLTALDGKDPADSATNDNPLVGHDFTRDLNPTALSGARLGDVTTRTCLTALCAGTGGAAGTDYVDTPQRPAAGTDARVLYDNALAAMTAQGATVVPITVTVPFVAPVAVAGSTNPGVLNYEFKRDLNAYLATRTTPGLAPANLQGVIDYNNANAGVALKFGQFLATTSQAVDLDPASPDTAAYNANRARDITQSVGPITTALAGPDGVAGNADDLSTLIYAAAGSAGIGAKAQFPTVAVPAGYMSGQATPAGTPVTGNRRPMNISFLGAKYTEPTLVGLAYSYEQATKLRLAPSVINPTAYRCTTLPFSAQGNCPSVGVVIPVPDTSNQPAPKPSGSTVRVYGTATVKPQPKGYRYTVKVFANDGKAPVGGRLVGLYVNGVRKATLRTGPKGTTGYYLSFRTGTNRVEAVQFGAPDLTKGVSPTLRVRVTARAR